jgi:hypothetical protein
MQSVGDFTDICLLHDHSNAYCTCLLCFRNWNTTILVLGAVQGLTYLLVGLEIQVRDRLICLKKICCQMIELICSAFLTTIGV